MNVELTHASFFSGVGGLDLGLERAGWRTVSFSEIDHYASAVLAERWPGVPNLGDIVRLAAGALGDGDARESSTEPLPDEVARAVLWTGGFPCQDLSVAGKRRGFYDADGNLTRSGLAHAFLDLVERYRPPAILLENVPGLLSSPPAAPGADFAELVRRLAELGYWWAYRILDAQFFGVPQRRRRVFIVALHAERGFGADSAAEVLSVGARCSGHSAAGDEAGEGAAIRPTVGALSVGGHVGIQPNGQDAYTGHVIAQAIRGNPYADHDGDDRKLVIAGTVRSGGHGDPGIGRDGDERRLVLSASPDASRVRAPDGLAGRLDDREVVGTLRVGPQRPQDGGPGDTVPIIAATLNSGGNDGGFRTEPGEHLIAQVPPPNPSHPRASGAPPYAPMPNMWVDRLPLGLDSHRYRCCGNGVVAPVSEWIGWRIRAAIEANEAVAA